MSNKPHPMDRLRGTMGALQAENAAALSQPTVTPSPAPPVEASPSAKKSFPHEVETPSSAPRGRPKSGKKSDASYCQTSILIEKETRTRVKRALLDAGEGQDMSQLVQSLLESWLKNQS